MKTTKPKAIYLIALTAMLLFACQSTPKAGAYFDDNIPSSLRNHFHEQNKLFIEDVKTNYQLELKGLLSRDLLRDQSGTVRKIDHVNNALKDADYSIFKEIYVVNKWRNRDTITGGHGLNYFNLNYTGEAKEMYFAFLLPKKGDNKRMITLGYANYDYGWRLFDIGTRPYTVNGKTAPELYQLSKQQQAKGYISDAATTMAAAVYCAYPSGFWQYTHEPEMLKYFGEVTDQANNTYKFPIMIKSTPTPISIFHIYNQRIAQGMFPNVCYVTKVSLKDTNAVKKENMLLRQQIGKAIPGIDKDNKELIYSAYNKMPGKDFQDHFDMTVRQ